MKKAKIAFSVALIVAIVVLAVFVPLGLFGYFSPDPTPINTRTQPTEGTFDAEKFTFQKVSVASYTKGTFATFTFVCNGKEYQAKYYLLSDYAPETVNCFLSYVRQKAYDGTVIYRAEKKFAQNGAVEYALLQGGTYKANGTGLYRDEPEEYFGRIKGEFPANGYEKNNITCLGSLCMMRDTSSYDSADCEFFFLPFGGEELNGFYAPFGVPADTQSKENVEQIARLCVAAGNTYNVTIKSVAVTAKK